MNIFIVSDLENTHLRKIVEQSLFEIMFIYYENELKKGIIEHMSDNTKQVSPLH